MGDSSKSPAINLDDSPSDNDLNDDIHDFSISQAEIESAPLSSLRDSLLSSSSSSGDGLPGQIKLQSKRTASSDTLQSVYEASSSSSKKQKPGAPSLDLEDSGLSFRFDSLNNTFSSSEVTDSLLDLDLSSPSSAGCSLEAAVSSVSSLNLVTPRPHSARRVLKYTEKPFKSPFTCTIQPGLSASASLRKAALSKSKPNSGDSHSSQGETSLKDVSRCISVALRSIADQIEAADPEEKEAISSNLTNNEHLMKVIYKMLPAPAAPSASFSPSSIGPSSSSSPFSTASSLLSLSIQRGSQVYHSLKIKVRNPRLPPPETVASALLLSVPSELYFSPKNPSPLEAVFPLPSRDTQDRLFEYLHSRAKYMNCEFTQTFEVAKVNRSNYSVKTGRVNSSIFSSWWDSDEDLSVKINKRNFSQKKASAQLFSSNKSLFGSSDHLIAVDIFPATQPPEKSDGSPPVVLKLYLSQEKFNQFLTMSEVSISLNGSLLRVWEDFPVSICTRCNLLLPHSERHFRPNCDVRKYRTQCAHCLSAGDHETVDCPAKKNGLSPICFRCHKIKSDGDKDPSSIPTWVRSWPIYTDHNARESLCPSLRAFKDKIRTSAKLQPASPEQ